MGREIRTRLPAHPLFALLVVSACAGCTVTPSTTPITANDPQVFNRSVSATIDYGNDGQSHSTPHSGDSIEIEAGRTTGTGSQTLAGGQFPVVIHYTTFNSPQNLRNDFDFRFVDAAYRYRKFFGESQSFGIEATAGLGYTSLHLSVANATQHDAGLYTSFAAKGSFAVIWRVRESTSLHARITNFRSLPSASAAGGTVTGADRFDLYLGQALGSNLSLRAGYAEWSVDGYADAVYPYEGSDFHITFRGPVVDLGCNF